MPFLATITSEFATSKRRGGMMAAVSFDILYRKIVNIDFN
jgi:hypothetical protein